MEDWEVNISRREGILQSCHGEKNENIQLFDHDMMQTCRKEKRLGVPKVRKSTSKTAECKTREDRFTGSPLTGQEKTIRKAALRVTLKKSGILSVKSH